MVFGFRLVVDGWWLVVGGRINEREREREREERGERERGMERWRETCFTILNIVQIWT